MIHDDIIGHSTVLTLLNKWLEKPANGYLFHGLPHLGKRMVAERFVTALLGTPSTELNLAHPDLILVQPEEGKVQIASKAVREARARCSSYPMVAERQVMYIPNADRLNPEGTNALLKVLEEPPAGAVFVLVTEDLSQLPDTLKSRIVSIPFHTVSKDEIKKHCLKNGADPNEIDLIVENSNGRPGLAIQPRETGDNSAKQFLNAKSLGERLSIIDDIVKQCDNSEDPIMAWVSTCDSWMNVFRKALSTADNHNGRRIMHAAKGLCGARRCVGTAVSPRMPLEQASLGLDIMKKA